MSQVQGWIPLFLAETEQILSLRDDLYVTADAPQYDREDAPHISLIENFWAPPEAFPAIQSAVDRLNIVGREGSVTGLKLFPEPDVPAVVMLDVALAVRDARQELIEVIRANGGYVPEHPKPPHITLFKTRTNGDPYQNLSVPQRARERLQTVRSSIDAFPVTVADAPVNKVGPSAQIPASVVESDD